MFKKLGQIFTGIWLAVKTIFGAKGKEAELQKYAETTKKVIAVIRRVIENPLLDLVTELTKTEIDDQALIIIRESLAELDRVLKIDTQQGLISNLKFRSEVTKDRQLERVETVIMKNLALKKVGVDLSENEIKQILAQTPNA